ncbi:MAG TPA: hypothetical protein VMR86_20170 [Myxococcota bacterium]|nr:hypothetical protein [Myxococcota bacterium]
MADSVRPPLARRPAWLAALALVLAAGAMVLWQLASRREAPDAHRAGMYQKTLASVRESCVPPKPNVESYCRDQAAFLLTFPECDADCVALARSIRHEPGR